MNLKVGDKVVVISGKSKGSEGKIIKTLKKENKVIVEGCNMVTKHIKPNSQNENSANDYKSNVQQPDLFTEEKQNMVI